MLMKYDKKIIINHIKSASKNKKQKNYRLCKRQNNQKNKNLAKNIVKNLKAQQ